MQKKIYIAGKVNPDSKYAKQNWREEYCNVLTKNTGVGIINLDPSTAPNDFDEGNPMLVFGRDCYMISIADIVIVNLTDDISVGGCQEMLIAKYLKKPLIGIAPRNGKFNRDEKIIRNLVYRNYLNPFVSVPCDVVVDNIDCSTELIVKYCTNNLLQVKNISIIDEALEYYQTRRLTIKDTFGGK